MTPQKPDPKRAGGLPYAIQLRLSTAQYRHLVVMAATPGRRRSLASVIRDQLDEVIDTKRVHMDEDDRERYGETSYRSLLEQLDGDALEQFAAKLDEE